MTLFESKHWLKSNANVLFFVGGFLFDVFTLNRIDNILDLIWQSVYLLFITLILVLQVAVQQGRWTPQGRCLNVWRFETEAIHFCYGGLLSGYVIFYFKSTSASRSLVFLSLVVLLMFANEMPQLKRYGARMRLGLYAFCLVSYLNYVIPVIAGQMGHWTFALAAFITAAICGELIRRLSQWWADPTAARWQLSWPPALILVVIISLYTAKWIPPVPLSLQYIGVFHSVERQGSDYRLIYPKPPWTRFWRRESRPFQARPGDSVYCFVRVFAPRRFTHNIFVRFFWQDPKTRRYHPSDRIPLPIYGGRGQGYRGFVTKSNYQSGLWRIETLTEDDRVIGSMNFRLAEDVSVKERVMNERHM